KAAARDAGMLTDSLLSGSQSLQQVALATTTKLKRKIAAKKFWAGTPRALFFLDPINFATRHATSVTNDWTMRLPLAQTVDGSGATCTMYFEVFSCNSLRPFMHLFRDHELLGSQDIIGGLPF